MGIRPLRISTGEEGKVYASTVGKNFSLECFLFPSQIFGSDLGGRRPSADRQKRAPKKYQPSALFFPSVTDNVCKKRTFSPSVTEKIHSFVSGARRRGGVNFFPARNRERVPKTNFSPARNR